MVRRHVDGRELVYTLRKAIGHIGGHLAILVRWRVEAFEERKGGRVGDRHCIYRAQLLDNKVGVTDDVVLVVQLLRRPEIVRVWINKISRVEMLDRHLDLERHVRLHRVQVGGSDELRRGHVGKRGDDTHRGRIAGTPFELLAVGYGQVDGQAKVDEVVRGG